MPRRREVAPREQYADAIYNSVLASKFINGIMKDGKKSVAQKIFYNAMKVIEKKAKDDPLKVLQQAYENVKPMLEVRSRRVGGSTYQIPIEVRYRRQSSLSIRWILGFARQRGEKTMEEKLANEILDAANNRGASIKKREDTHKMAEANKAFAHYKW